MYNDFLSKKIKISKKFDQVSKYYEKNNFLQKISGNYLKKVLGIIRKNCILDAGSGTGFFSRFFKKHNYVIALDSSWKMLQYSKYKNSADFYVLGDMEYIPIKNESIDVIFSNLSIQWCDMKKVKSEFFRIIKKGGKIAFSTLVKGSLVELQNAWKKIDDYKHINSFEKKENIISFCFPYKYDIFFKVKKFYYYRIIDIFRDFKNTGTNYVDRKNSFSGLIGKQKIKKIEKFWPRKEKEKFILSYIIAYGIIHCE
ncbi:methyltransferase domain-containing protein [bacterium endosymbiont of Pedicinus badii]|uniref:methyltransferase domain-containing protein n=1 Tax=bacterium endosymbiont of Pedicinus badii TaxID=1719126 RepID=UPI0009BB532D|nr:methyltransferase domain-containing protein [bacterium endosymbiont of Pedicinus badii]OQM34335.1 hypothetical protein AOQ89_00350 [bacterium endosymbiont of Pedicinus badii]